MKKESTEIQTLPNHLATKEVQKDLQDYIMKPFSKPTPAEKVQRREDGFDYVQGSYMDYSFKQDHPLYSTELLQVNVENSIGWVYAAVRITDIVTGNSEIGAGAARIQVSRDAKERGNITPFDIIDFDKNIKSAVTNAIKNTQMRFGTCADIYQRREETLTEDEKTRFESLILNAPIVKRQIIRDAWKKLKFDYSDFLDKLENRYPTTEVQAKVVDEKPKVKQVKADAKIETKTEKTETKGEEYEL
jgi:hypothetical protein